MSLSNILRKTEPVQFTPIVEEQYEVVKSIGLFDFFKAFYSLNKEVWSSVTDEDKMKHSFMLFRFLSIKEPDICMMLQNSINPTIIDNLHIMFSRTYNGKSPGWMYTSTKKAVKAFDPKGDEKIAFQKIISTYKLDSKDVEYLIRFHQDVLTEIIKNVDNNLDKKIK